MDYRINNEAVTACVASQVVLNGFNRLEEVVGLTNLLMHEKERKKFLSTHNMMKLTTIVGHLDGGLLTIIMNSLVLMIQGGCMTFGNGILTLTQSGIHLCEQMKDGRSYMLSLIINDLPDVIHKVVKMDEKLLCQRYVITL